MTARTLALAAIRGGLSMTPEELSWSIGVGRTTANRWLREWERRGLVVRVPTLDVRKHRREVYIAASQS